MQMSNLRPDLRILITVAMLAWPGQTLGGQSTPPGQPPQSPRRSSHLWWRDEQIASAINLSAVQVGLLQRIFDASIVQQRQVYQTVLQAQRELDALLPQDKPDRPTVVLAMQQLEFNRTSLTLSRDIMLLRMRQVLSASQRRDLAALHPEVRLEPQPLADR